jgi:hypothetical protein
VAATRSCGDCYLDKDRTVVVKRNSGRRQSGWRQRTDYDVVVVVLDLAPGRAVGNRVVHCCCLYEGVGLGGAGDTNRNPSVDSPQSSHRSRGAWATLPLATQQPRKTHRTGAFCLGFLQCVVDIWFYRYRILPPSFFRGCGHRTCWFSPSHRG